MNKITRLQQAMPASMQAIVLRDGANRFYLTGMKSSAGPCWPPETKHG